MSVLGADDIRAVMAEDTAQFDDDALQELINGEEAWLERRVGQLVGERTETFLAPDSDDTIHLRRPTDEVAVTDDGDVTTVVLSNDGRSFTRSLDYWIGDVAVTYEPNDYTEVRRVVAELVRLAIQESGGYTSETIGAYSYTVDPSLKGARRRSLVRSLLAPSWPSTVRVHSSVVA